MSGSAEDKADGSDNEGLKQRLDEWTHLDQAGLEYHTAQWRAPKQSTLKFEEFVRARMMKSLRVIDLACGAGAATAFLATRHPGTSIVGIDYSSDLIALAGELAKRERIRNVCFEQGDWFDLSAVRAVDGVVSMQTLSWLPEFEAPLQQIFERIGPQWVGISSLFYPGEITCRTEIEEHRRGVKQYYNTYSLPAVRRYCARYGYDLVETERFAIDIDLPKPDNNDIMRTFTIRTAEQCDENIPERLQISGPMLMNWYFVLLERTLV